MSKIQFNELNNASLEVLNETETTAVVGGFIAFSDLSYRQNIALVSANNNAGINQGGYYNQAAIYQGSAVNVNQG